MNLFGQNKQINFGMILCLTSDIYLLMNNVGFLIAMIMAMINVVSMAPIVVLTFVLHGPENEE